MAEQGKLSLDIVTPERRVYSGTADFAVFPGAEGELGILPGHAPLLSRVKFGEVKISHKSYAEFCFVDEGFLEVRDNMISLVAEIAELATDIDLKAAETARDQALENLEHIKDEHARAHAETDLKKAMLRVSIAVKGCGQDPKQKK
jgi:F-type H+-transporting ATPase subunit epsilon